MYDRFTAKARAVVARAEREARALHDGHVGTEHLLLGLLLDEGGVALEALAACGVTAANAREAVLRAGGRDRREHAGELPLTRNARKVLTDAGYEADVFGHAQVGPRHVLLALTRVGEDTAVRVLSALTGDVAVVRAEIIRRLDERPDGPDLRERVGRLEREVLRLRDELDELRGQMTSSAATAAAAASPERMQAGMPTPS
ncbi:MAG TPA: Clp protease N-terminal domain-containing protein [Frankiaceae bacterium]|nr:Clp protease N-terminal domain-containing protein [Frankiaceae bacterium]